VEAVLDLGKTMARGDIDVLAMSGINRRFIDQVGEGAAWWW
jgi:hypothetical protein